MVEPAGGGIPLLYVTILLLTLSWTVVAVRVVIRMMKKVFGLDDWLMCIGLLFFIAEFFYASCTAPIKCSICVTLLRVADARRRFVWTLRGLMAGVAIAAIVFIAAIANICHPITNLWGETTTGTCNSKLNSSVSFFFSAVSIITDWTLAILPAILLWSIQMEKRMKISIAFILGLAAFASCATIVRLRFLTLYNNQAEFMFSTGAIGLWSIIEEGIGLIAGSMPALRPLLSPRAFITRSSNATGGSKYQQPGNHHGIKLDTIRAEAIQKTESRYNKIDNNTQPGDGDSQKNILSDTNDSDNGDCGGTQ
ncbi:cation-transporting ATPase 4 [Xylariales sp. PMI_506]|nr:cation-transporting ATPase 4 [Xylariales sp. PMI_506]